ncbi:MAG: hypothetical protein JO249_17385 [Acidobacteria bacterium]|nr:hypothetical protein [Acidobacteriota bacterium]
MSSKRTSHKHWLEFFPTLLLLGILAGAIGGLAVGVMTSRTASSSASSH